MSFAASSTVSRLRQCVTKLADAVTKLADGKTKEAKQQAAKAKECAKPKKNTAVRDRGNTQELEVSGAAPAPPYLDDRWGTEEEVGSDIFAPRKTPRTGALLLENGPLSRTGSGAVRRAKKTTKKSAAAKKSSAKKSGKKR